MEIRLHPPRRKSTCRPKICDDGEPTVECMRIIVDLNRCQNYGQCVYAAPGVFRFVGTESIEYDHAPDSDDDVAVRRAAVACPMSAITLGEEVRP